MKFNLACRRILAIILILIVVIPGFYIMNPAFVSLIENYKLSQSRDFDIVFGYNFNGQIAHRNDTASDVVIDLAIHYPSQILTVDEPVKISGKAFLSNTSSAITSEGFILNSQKVKSITMNFYNSHLYPLQRDGAGIVKGANLMLNRDLNDNILEGNTTATWTMEGTYHPTLAILLNINNTYDYIVTGEAQGVAITVYPKTEASQIITNNAMLYLTIAMYLIAIVGSIPIFTMKAIR